MSGSAAAKALRPVLRAVIEINGLVEAGIERLRGPQSRKRVAPTSTPALPGERLTC